MISQSGGSAETAAQSLLSLPHLDLILGSLGEYIDSPRVLGEYLKNVLDEKIPGNEVVLDGDGEILSLSDLPERVARIKKAWPHCTLLLVSSLGFVRNVDWFQAMFEYGLDKFYIMRPEVPTSEYRENIIQLALLPRNIRYARIFSLGEKRCCATGVPHDECLALAEADLLSAAETLPLEHAWTSHHAHLSMQNTSWEIPIPCNVVYGFKACYLNIEPNLDIIPCCRFRGTSYAFGNLETQELKEIFDGSLAQNFRTHMWNMELDKIPVCRTCSCYSTETNNREEIDRIVAWQARQLAGKRIFFWGAGQAYRQFSPFFNLSDPVGIILNDAKITEWDDLPILSPDILTVEQYRLYPVVIFGSSVASGIILRQIQKKYQLPLNQIYICPPNYFQSFTKH